MQVKLFACADLIRMDLAIGAGFFLVAGEILVTGGLPPIQQVILGFLTLFFISGSANISNDYFDREVDKINLPSRPLPSGWITIRELWAFFSLFTILGFVTASLLGPEVLILVFLLWGIAFFYNMKFKECGFFGNFIVAFCLGMIFILAGILAGTINGVILTFAGLAFFFDLGEEVASDVMDVKGDEIRSSKSIAKRWGKDKAMVVSGLMFVVFFLLTLIPFLMGWLWYDYLILALIMDLWMIICVIKLMRNETTDKGRVQIRRLYLTWGLFVFVFAFSRIL
ncbi:UbiA family prenyltransferase [Methanospirillum stamsii]|nr:UbiA family prenyltransferase [Methanospirillum stamsii]